MARRSVDDRWAVVTYFKEGQSPAEMVRTTGFNFHFVLRWIAAYKATGTVNEQSRPGRKRKLSVAKEGKVVSLMHAKRKRSCQAVAQILKDEGLLMYTVLQ